MKESGMIQTGCRYSGIQLSEAIDADIAAFLVLDFSFGKRKRLRGVLPTKRIN